MVATEDVDAKVKKTGELPVLAVDVNIVRSRSSVYDGNQGQRD